MTRSLDFGALAAAVDPADLREWVTARRRKAKIAGASPGWRVFFGVLLALILVPIVALVAVMAFGLITSPNLGALTPTAAAGMSVGLLVVMVVFVAGLRGVASLWRERGQWEQWFRLDRFAAANDLHFARRDKKSRYPGSVFEGAAEILLSDHLSTRGDRVLDYGTVSRITHSGGSTSSQDFAYIAVKLDAPLPHMLLDAKRNGATSVVMARDQRLSLEGDFDEHFTLYAPSGYERDALYVFTPDLMALLIDEASAFDVEIVDDWMLFHSSKLFNLQHPSTHERVFRIADIVGAKALRQTAGYGDDRSRRGFAIAPAGRRLRRTLSVSGVILAVFVALLPFIPLAVQAITGR